MCQLSNARSILSFFPFTRFVLRISFKLLSVRFSKKRPIWTGRVLRQLFISQSLLSPYRSSYKHNTFFALSLCLSLDVINLFTLLHTRRYRIQFVQIVASRISHAKNISNKFWAVQNTHTHFFIHSLTHSLSPSHQTGIKVPHFNTSMMVATQAHKLFVFTQIFFSRPVISFCIWTCIFCISTFASSSFLSLSLFLSITFHRTTLSDCNFNYLKS